jgi:hypothetical protein
VFTRKGKKEIEIGICGSLGRVVGGWGVDLFGWGEKGGKTEPNFGSSEIWH